MSDTGFKILLKVRFNDRMEIIQKGKERWNAKCRQAKTMKSDGSGKGIHKKLGDRSGGTHVGLYSHLA